MQVVRVGDRAEYQIHLQDIIQKMNVLRAERILKSKSPTVPKCREKKKVAKKKVPYDIEAIYNFICEKEQVHSLFIQVEGNEVTLDYSPQEERVLGRTITQSQGKCRTQMYLLKNGIQKFEFKGETAVKEELSQMNHRTCFH